MSVIGATNCFPMNCLWELTSSTVTRTKVHGWGCHSSYWEDYFYGFVTWLMIYLTNCLLNICVYSNKSL